MIYHTPIVLVKKTSCITSKNYRSIKFWQLMIRCSICAFLILLLLSEVSTTNSKCQVRSCRFARCMVTEKKVSYTRSFDRICISVLLIISALSTLSFWDPPSPTLLAFAFCCFIKLCFSNFISDIIQNMQLKKPSDNFQILLCTIS